MSHTILKYTNHPAYSKVYYSDAYIFLKCCNDVHMKMGMCMCVAWLNGLSTQCPGMAKSPDTPLNLPTYIVLHQFIGNGST